MVIDGKTLLGDFLIRSSTTIIILYKILYDTVHLYEE